MTAFVDDAPPRHDLRTCQAQLDDLRAALRTRPVIDQAKGILMARHGCTPGRAFEMLAEASQRQNRKLRDIAAAIVDCTQAPKASN
jgi:AmiR/NasT family two-component response regulator